MSVTSTKMEAARSFETMVSYIITGRQNSEDHDTNLHRRENFSYCVTNSAWYSCWCFSLNPSNDELIFLI